MTVIQVGGDTRDRLQHASGRVEVQDEDGHILGYFEPARELSSAAMRWASSETTIADVERARESTDRISTAELLDHLRQQS